MNWVPTVLMLMTIVLLTVQGIVLLSRGRRSFYPHDSNTPTPHTFLVGLLNVFLALFALTAFFLFASGALILSPEYGVLFAQGSLAWLWAMAIIAGVTVGFAWLLHRIRVMFRLRSSRFALIVGGCVVTLITIWRATLLNVEEPAEFRIRCMDLWSYFFLAWVVALLTLWILIVVYKSSMPWRRRLLGVVFALSLCGLVATFHATVGLAFADSWTLPLWRVTVWIGVPWVMGVLTWSSLTKRRPNWPKGLPHVLCAVAVAAGVYSAFEWTKYADGLESWTKISSVLYGCIALWGIWGILLSVLPLVDWYRLAAAAVICEQRPSTLRETLRELPEVIHDALKSAPDIGSPGRSDDIVALVCFGIMAGSIIDLSHSARLDPIWDLAALIASWLVISEILAVYPLYTFIRGRLWLMREDEHYLKTLAKSLWAGLAWVLTPIRWLFTADTWKGAVAKIALFLMIVIGVSELPNAGKTVVLSFSSTDLDNKAQDTDKGASEGKDLSKEMGRLVSERVVNTIGVVGRDIRPSLLVADTDGKVAWIPTSSDTTSNMQASFANSSFQIPGTTTTIPLSGVVTSVQELARWLMNVRQISGSVQKQGSRYVLLASSSTGDTWRVEETLAPSEAVSATSNPPKKIQGATAGERGVKPQPLPASPVAKSSKAEVANAANRTASAQPPAGAPTPLAAIEELADNLAHNIIASDMRLQGYGITSVPAAMADFSAGVSEWRAFEVSEDEKALTQSIIHFHNAVDKDPQFGLAYYRLGQAYLSDGQPRAAADAFRESVRTNPGFVAGHIALAETLYYLPDYYYPTPAAKDPGNRVKIYTTQSRQRDLYEARQELETVIRELQPSLTVTWRAAAYLGLCRDAYERNELSPSQSSRYVAFFYCRRAEYLYSRLPAAVRSDSRIKSKEVLLLANLGEMLNPFDEFEQGSEISDRIDPRSEDWLCDPNAVYESFAGKAVMPYNTYLKASQRYYELALAKAPDDPYIRCKYARVLAVHRNDDQMKELVKDEKAHLSMAEGLTQEGAYADALSEVTRAIELAPYDVEALNTYAYFTWRWYWSSVREGTPGPSRYHLRIAAYYADRAVQITEDKGPRKDHGVYQSTLGEVLFATGDFDLAYRTLREIFYHDPVANEDPRGSDVSEQAIYDEIRWDLAQAAICASAKNGSQSARRSQAIDLLGAIRQHEKAREDQRFSGMLEVPGLQDNCSTFRTGAMLAQRAPLMREVQYVPAD